MSQSTVVCWNPKCGLRIRWRKGKAPPKSCPLCGYDQSKKDQAAAEAEARVK